jgi:hypothetical protein
MGILDDAIREHLELKRRHGVTEDELQRQEEEALGPARRDVAQQHEEADPAAAGQDAALFDGEEPAAASEEPVAAEEHPAALDEPPSLAEEAPVAGQPPVGQAPEISSRAPDHELDAGDDEPGPEPEPALEAEPEPEPEPALEEEPEDEDDLADSDLEDEDGDNDVLEDTPDFLQETPEHDRLWFEQKPPRDFDFD